MQDRKVSKYMNKMNSLSLILFFASVLLKVQIKNFCFPVLCSSMVIRDLTLRSAASFGSFHLIRLLYDEYMYYLIEHRVAQAKGETPIAVMGEVQTHSHTHEHRKQLCDK